jgi:hypothetical protein
MRERNRFQKGSGMYQCRCCGRNTRSTGNGDNENVRLCEQCYELAGYENMVQDGGELSDRDRETIKQLIAQIEEKGGANTFADLLSN